MSTLENLFMQIFDRRNWIVDQLKSQTDSYDQSLASNLLIHGIRPPSWLWNPAVSDTQNADPKELKKEELISGLLFPPPQPPIPSFTTHAFYRKQAFKQDNGQLSESLGMETCASNKCFVAGDASTGIPRGSINENVLGQTCYRHGVPEPIPNSTSSCVHVDTKISDMHFAPDQSASNFACHSKKASKADDGQPSQSLVMEMTSSSKCLVTGDRSTAICKGSINENEVGQAGYTNEVPELIPSPAADCIQMDAKSPDMHFEPDQSLLMFPRSRSRQKALEIRNSGKAEKKRRSLKENIAKPYSGRVTRSRTANKQLTGIMDSPELKNHVASAKKSGVKVTRSTSTSYDPNCVDKSLSLEKPLKCIRDVGIQRAAGPDVTIPSDHAIDNGVFPSNSANDIADQQTHATEALPTKIMSNTLDASHSNCSGSKMASTNYGLWSSVSRLPTGSNMFLEPKQLNFGDVEDCSMNQDDSPVLEEEKGSLFEMRVLSKSPTIQSAKEENITKDFQLTNDFVNESSLLAQSSKQETISKDIDETHDFAEELVLEEFLHTAEVSIGEVKALKISTSDQVEKRFDFTEVKNIGKDVSSVSFTFKPSNLSPPSLTKRTSSSSKEIRRDALADSIPVSNVIAEQTEVAADHPSTLQEGGGQCSLGSQLPLMENLNLPKIVTPPPIGSPIDQKGIGELDVGCPKIRLEAYELKTAACDDLSKLTGIVFSDNDPINSDILSKAHETKFCDLAIDTKKRSVLEQAVTPKAGQTQNQGPRYYLRSSTSHDRNLSHSKLNGSSDALKSRKLDKTIDHACEISWPMCKRRKINSQSNNVFNTSPRVRRARPYMQQIHENNICPSLGSSKNASEVILEFQQLPSSNEMEDEELKVVIEGYGLEVHQRQKRRKTEGSELSPKLQSSTSTLQEGELDSEDKSQCDMSPAKTSIDITRQADGYSQGYSRDVGQTMTEPRSVLNVKRLSDSDDGTDLVGNRLRQEDLKGSAHNEGLIEEIKSQLGDQGLFSSTSGSPSYNVHANLNFIDAEKAMPELEGFSVGLPSEIVVGSGINFDDLAHLDISSITKERTGVLDQLCRSTCIFTPLPRSSTKYKIHTTPDVCQSLPNGLLEHMSLQKALLFNPDDGIGGGDGDPTDVSCYTGSKIEASFLGRSYSDCMPSSSAQFGWDVGRPPYTPPAGNIHHKIISKSTGYSSEKQVSLNPEFTCFRIDEDTSLDEVVDSLQQGTENISNKREALVDVTSEYHNSPTLVSAAVKFPDRDSIDSVNTEFHSRGIQMGAKLQNGYGSDRRYKIEDKENHSSLMGGNGSRKAKEFSQKRFTRSKLSEKASEKKGSETFLDKGCKHNNIVSNISSFIPLVQQKQAAAVLTGKRDVKVKALEVAEAAKRLEEKREIERKMRKETAKVERAKQENIRQLELKKKEEERKKKEVEMAARKRQREEEERKEKERKRKCIEEARKQQREHDEKLRAEKELLRRKAAEGERKRKELAEETKKQQKREKEKEEAGCRKRTEVEPSSAKVEAGHAKHASSIREDHEMSEVRDHIGKVVSDSHDLHKVNEDGIMVIEENQEMQSYEMSPYQGSDDEEEDDEDDDMVKRKFIPLWARSKCLAQSLLSLQHMDPSEIFLRERCFSSSEVVFPRERKPL